MRNSFQKPVKHPLFFRRTVTTGYNFLKTGLFYSIH